MTDKKTNTYKKIREKLKIVDKSPNLKITPEVILKNMNKITSYNEAFIEVLSELAALMTGQGEVFRAKA